jgi:tRNA(Ile)-lysidine synthase
MTIKEKAKRAIAKHKMLSSGDTVLVGVSGGPDSMALLYILMDLRDEYGITLRVAHLNHGFRREAADEADFVRRITSSLDIPAVIRFIDVPSIMEKEGLSAQEAARNVRYAFFKEAAKETGANKVALAHTSDDQAETVLMRLLRGSGPQGLSGIPPVRDMLGDCPYLRAARRRIGTVPGMEVNGQQLTIIRPLMDCSRKEIEGYLSERGIPFVTDISNLKMGYLRNRVRMELIPFLEGYNPNIKETLIRTGELAYRDEDFLETEADKAYQSITVPSVDGLTMEFKALKGLHAAISSRVIRRGIMEVKGDMKRISFEHISDILSLLHSGEGRWSLHLPDVTVSREHDRVILKKEKGRR